MTATSRPGRGWRCATPASTCAPSPARSRRGPTASSIYAGGHRRPLRRPVRLLPAFDEHLLGWRDGGFLLAPEPGRRIHPGGGIIRAVVLVDGAVVGTWSADRRGGRLRVALRPLPGRTLEPPEDELADLARAEGLERAGAVVA